MPHQNNGHTVYQQGYLDGRLYIGGTETATNNPGYMDGAVLSALYLSERILAYFKSKA